MSADGTVDGSEGCFNYVQVGVASRYRPHYKICFSSLQSWVHHILSLGFKDTILTVLFTPKGVEITIKPGPPKEKGPVFELQKIL